MGKILSFCLVLLWTIPTTAGNTWCPLQIEWFNTTTVEFYHDASKTYDMPYSGGSIQVVFYTPSTPTTGDAQTLQTNIRNRISSQGYSSWLSLSGVYPGQNKFMANFTLKANTSGSTRELAFYTASGNTATVIQPTGEVVHSINEAGTYKVLPGETLTITLDGYTSGTTYYLYRDGMRLSVNGTILAGNSGVRFTTDAVPGTYAIHTSSGTQMNGYVTVKSYDINTTAALSYHTDRIELDGNGGIFRLICPRIGDSETVIEELEEIVRKCTRGECPGWTGDFRLALVRYDASEVEFSLSYGPNTDSSALSQTTAFAVQVGGMLTHITFSQPAGGGVTLFDVDYELLRDDYSRFNITLSGSQPGTNYVVKRGETTCGEATGTGDPLIFGNMTTQGNYNVYAVIAGKTVRMNGTAEVFDTASTLSDGNRIRTKRFVRPNRAESVADVTYFDGFGFPMQEVSVKASPEGTNLVTPYYYDEMRRDNARSYMPYVSPSKTGEMVTTAFAEQQAYFDGLYGSLEVPYSENRFEASPLNRIVRSYSPGKIFRTQEKYIGFEYASNAADEVRRIVPNTLRNGLTINGCYAVGQLFKERATDEDGGITETFRDKQKRTILTRSSDGTTILDTYYIYDDTGNLCYVLPPAFSVSLGNTTELMDGADAVTQFAYIYKYDARNRMVSKKLPGAEPVYLVYDKGNRLVLLQDGNLRERNRWVYNVYDNFGNRRISSLVTQQSALTREAIQDRYDAAGFDNSYPTLGGSPDPAIPFSDGSFTLLAILAESRYGGDGFTIPAGLAPAAVAETVDPATDIDGRTCGLKTYDRLAVLNNEDFTDIAYVERAYYYDYEKRVVQTVEKNLLGGISRTSRKYDFTGNILAAVESHEMQGQTHTLRTRREYDCRGRLLAENSTLDDGTPVEIRYAYDGLGRVVGRTTGDGKFVTSLSYNLLGWQTGQVSRFGEQPLFSARLSYYQPEMSATTPSYTGNVSEWTWQHAGRDENTYAFAYDSFARLTDTRHYEAGALTDRFAEKGLTYDANGNLRTLMRTGNGLTLNDLEYSYTGNRIASIADAGAVYDYGYDANGNMTHDGANDLDITYNCLNMTQKVEKKGTLSANYSYLADSTKLSATEPGGDGLYYSGSLVYGKRDGKLSLESAGFNGGRFVVTSNGIQTHLFVTDHLGSVRAVVDPASGEATETNDYYPFGLRWEDAEALISDNRYRYNGKEEQVFVGIPYVDFGFRMMDPEFRIGWNTADPKSEKYSGSSPYIYCGNDPIGNIDPDGSVYDKYYNSLGYLMYDTGKGDKTYVIRAAGYERDFRVNSISEQAAIDTENAIRQGNLSGPHMQNIMEIESVPTLKKMRNTIKDDGTGGDSDNNNREYGGIVNHEGQIANVSQGEVRESGKHASVSINPKGARSVYHSHPSGSKNLGPLKGSSRFPSRQDHKSIGTATGYLFQMRTKEIIVFDNKKIEAIVSFSILEDLYK